MIGSLIILLGTDVILFGFEGLLFGLGKWVGGLLIFALVSFFSIPFGLGLRFMFGKLPFTPLIGALIGGLCVGFGLIFLLHPYMRPSLSFVSHPVHLSVVHLAAGLCAALVWWGIEFRVRKSILDE